MATGSWGTVVVAVLAMLLLVSLTASYVALVIVALVGALNRVLPWLV